MRRVPNNESQKKSNVCRVFFTTLTDRAPTHARVGPVRVKEKRICYKGRSVSLTFLPTENNYPRFIFHLTVTSRVKRKHNSRTYFSLPPTPLARVVFFTDPPIKKNIPCPPVRFPLADSTAPSFISRVGHIIDSSVRVLTFFNGRSALLHRVKLPVGEMAGAGATRGGFRSFFFVLNRWGDAPSRSRRPGR